MTDPAPELKPFFYAIADKYGQPVLDETCVAANPDLLQPLYCEGDKIVPVYAGPEIERLRETYDHLAEKNRKLVYVLERAKEAVETITPYIIGLKLLLQDIDAALAAAKGVKNG